MREAGAFADSRERLSRLSDCGGEIEHSWSRMLGPAQAQAQGDLIIASSFNSYLGEERHKKGKKTEGGGV